MKDKFPGMENYTLLSQISPDVYGYINSVVLAGKNNGTEVYRMPRTTQYMPAYSPIRDRMYMGLHVVYVKMIELLKGQPVNNGGFQNYFLICVETGNDKPQKIISFDGYVIKANSDKELYMMKKFRAIPGIDDRTLHSAIFMLNRQYEKDMELIDIENTVFHMKAYRHRAVKIDTFEMKDFTFDIESEDCQKFIQSVFNGTNRNLYSIGLTHEPTELLRNITGFVEIKKEEAPVDMVPTVNPIVTAVTQSAPAQVQDMATAMANSKMVTTSSGREMRDLGLLDVSEVLGDATKLVDKSNTSNPAKTVEIED